MRHTVIIVLASLLLNGCSTFEPKPPNEFVDLVIGTFTQQGSQGVYATRLGVAHGDLSEPRLLLEATDPTYLTISDKGVVYGAIRAPGGQVNAFVPTTQGARVLNSQSAGGEAPCYISLSPSQTQVASANYRGGNVAVFALANDGSIEPNPEVLQHHGASVHPQRQTAPHPHWVEWSPYRDDLLYVVDLGLDKVMKYSFNPGTGQLGEREIAFEATPGAGPRHLVFHPTQPLAYIVNELANSVTLVKVQPDGTFSFIDEASTLPAEYEQHNQTAHIAISEDGSHLYVSNRGLNSIAVFDLADDGMMHLQDNVPTGGDWPRFFTLLDEYGYLLVANRNSDEIEVFAVAEDGGLKATEKRISVPQPTYIGEL